MNSSKFKPKESSAIKKLQNSTEIDVLYQQFQSLKSQIYGVKRQPKPKNIEVQWSSKSNKQKAVQMLRESTIHKCQQQLQSNLSLLHSNQPKLKQNLFKRSTHQQQITVNDYVDVNESHLESRNFSKKFKDYEEEPSMNFQQSARQSISEQNLCFTDGEELFRQFLNKTQRPIIADLSSSKKSSAKQETFIIPQIQVIFSQIVQDHMKKLGFLLQTLTFMSRKLHCLQMIIQQYGKILKANFQNVNNRKKQQSQIIINVSALQSKYEDQLKKLSQFYQHELKKQSSKQQKKQQTKTESSFALEELKKENKNLNDLLAQAKRLINTKEDLINALTEQNQELKEQVDKLKKPNFIRNSADSSLGYSGTADKHVKRDNSLGDMQLISQKLKLAISKQGVKRDWDEFQQGSNNDINYSQLQSVKDKSLDQWDISQLQLRQTSNAKSLEDEINTIRIKDHDLQ